MLLAYYFGIDAEKLTDEQKAKKMVDVQWLEYRLEVQMANAIALAFNSGE